MRAALLLALLAVGCAGAGVDAAELGDVVASSGSTVERWLPPEHPAAAAQARWGLPLACDLQVRELDAAELGHYCQSDDPKLRGCAPAGRCTIAIASGLSAARRQVVLTHELGHVLDPFAGHVELGCPVDAPGEHLMCEQGPASGSPDPTLADFDLVL